MATKRTKTEEPKLTLDNPEVDEEFEDIREEVNETAEKLDKDEEIRRLKAELEKTKAMIPIAVGSEKEAVRKLTEQAAAEGTDPWTVTVKIRVPRRPEKEDPWYWVNINGRSAQIPANDKMQEMKLPFAEVLLSQLKAEDDLRDYLDNVQVYDPVTNPHPVER